MLCRIASGVLLLSLIAVPQSRDREEQVRAALDAAQALWGAGKYAQAREPFETVVRLNPALHEPWFALGICYAQTGERARAEQALRKFLALEPASADGRAALGMVLLEQGRTSAAGAEFEAALRLDPQLAEARKGLARVSYAAGRYRIALSTLAPLLAGGREGDAGAYALAARCLAGLDQRHKALELCERGLARDPDAGELEALHVSLLLDCRYDETCRQKTIEGLRRKPRSPTYLKGVAELLLDREPCDSLTAQMVQRAFESLPGDPGAGYLHARLHLVNRRYELALQEAEPICRMREAGPEMKMQALTIAGLAYAELGQAAAADQAFRQALSLNRSLRPPNPRVAFAYVDYLAKNERPAEADGLVTEILRWSPSFGPAHLQRAKSLWASGKRQGAIREANLALRFGLDDPGQMRAAHVLLVKTYFALGQIKEAQVHQDWVVRNREQGNR